MKGLRNLAMILSITLIVSFFSIIVYASFNNINAVFSGVNSFYRTNNKTTIDNDKEDHDWIQTLPFVPDGIKDTIRESIYRDIHDSIDKSMHDSSTYNKIGDTIVDDFSYENIDKISINTDVADIDFKKENREDIKVVYVYTKPDTDNYTINYNADIDKNTLDITQRIVTKNFFGNMNSANYTNNITVYVPNDIELDTIYINNNLGDIDNSELFSQVKDINLTSELGQISITLNNPKESVVLNSSIGQINCYNNSPIDSLEISSSSGHIYMESNNTIKKCTVDTDIGSIHIVSNDKINTCNLESDIGAITAAFKKTIDSFDISSNLGSINIDLYNNDDSIISTDVSIGKIKSDFPTSSKKGNYNVNCDMGDITIRKK